MTRKELEAAIARLERNKSVNYKAKIESLKKKIAALEGADTVGLLSAVVHPR